MGQWPAILQHVPPAMLVVFRIGGLMVFGPVFGSRVIPVQVKVFLSVLLGLAVYPLVGEDYLAGGAPALDLWALAPLVAVEMLVGMAIGYLASFPMVAVQTGGLMMGQQMGLGFARFYNPAVDDEADVIGQILFFLALALFLIAGGHEAIVLAMFDSFKHIPLGEFVLDMGFIDLVTGLLLSAFEFALRVAAPLLTLIFLESLAMGFIAKTVPQLNILSLGFPLRILAGVTLVALGVTVISEVMMESIDETLNAIFDWVHSQ